MQGGDVRAIRQRSGLSQAEFGTAIGLSRPTVSLMESGKAPIEDRTAKHLRLFSTYLDLVEERNQVRADLESVTMLGAHREMMEGVERRLSAIVAEAEASMGFFVGTEA